MKKMLSLTLAILLIFSCVPIFSAIEATPDEKAFCEELIRYNSSYASYYNINGKGVNGTALYKYGYKDIYSAVDELPWFNEMNNFSSIGDWIKANPEKLDDCTTELKAINDEWDAFAAEKGYVKILDLYDMYYMDTIMSYYHDSETEAKLVEFFENETDREALQKIDDEFMAKMEDIMEKAENDATSVVQKDFDEAFKDYYNFVIQLVECFIGNHIVETYTDTGDGTHKGDCTFCKTVNIAETHKFVTYIANNDATTEKDGTKTAKCEKCSATDTVTDEGSKLPAEEENSNFIEAFIKAIKDFFARIADFFKNLFK